MLTIPRSQQAQLVDLADATIRGTLVGEHGVPEAANLFEAIGATVSTAFPAAADAWRSVLAPLGVTAKVIGAFSFGVPKVAFIDGGVAHRCDLAACLVIVDDQTAPVSDRRALLLSLRRQADPAPPGQGRLYAEWPAFRFADTAYEAGSRDLRAAKGETNACFAEIDLARKEPEWTLAEPCRSGGGRSRDSLGALLVAMVVGAGGRKAVAGGTDAWSQTVDDLLRSTARATAGGLSRQSRVRSAATYKGECGSGFVVVENRQDLPLDLALAKIVAQGDALPEGPISVVHVVLRRHGILN